MHNVLPSTSCGRCERVGRPSSAAAVAGSSGRPRPCSTSLRRVPRRGCRRGADEASLLPSRLRQEVLNFRIRRLFEVVVPLTDGL